MTPRPDPCRDQPCGPNANCRVVGGRHQCSCISEFLGSPPFCRPPCVRPEDCPASKACIKNRCTDPCPGVCGINAECTVVSHNPICSCISGYTGDPFIRCTVIPIAITPPPTTPRPPIAVTSPYTTQPPISEVKDISEETIIPGILTTTPASPIGITVEKPQVQEYDPCDPSPCGANAICSVDDYDRVTCDCVDGYFGNAWSLCGPYCILDSDCDSDYACINRKCKDPCIRFCGQNADCHVSQHQPKCTCWEGFNGDPYERCFLPPISRTTSEHAFGHSYCLEIY